MLVTFLIAAAATIISVICGFRLGFRWDDPVRLDFYRSVGQAMVYLRRVNEILERESISPSEIEIAHRGVADAITALGRHLPDADAKERSEG